MRRARREFLKTGLAFAASHLTAPSAEGFASVAANGDVASVNMEIVGASFDPASREVVLIGRQNHLYPAPIYPDDLVVAMRAVMQSQADAIGVSIDRGPSDDQMIVNYFPENIESLLQDTRFGETLFVSDYLLKTYGLKKDPMTGREVASSVKAYRSELDYQLEDLIRSLQAGPASTSRRPSSNWYRLWFELLTGVSRSPDKLTMVFDNPVMLVKTEKIEFDAQRRAIRNPQNLQSPPAARAFSSQMTRLLGAFGKEQPQLRRLPEMAKLVRVARWALDLQLPVSRAHLDSFPVFHQPTPRTVPTATVTKSFDFGWARYYASLYGGVSLNQRNDYAHREAMHMKHKVSSARSQPGFKTWAIELDGYQYLAAQVNSILGVR